MPVIRAPEVILNAPMEKRTRPYGKIRLKATMPKIIRKVKSILFFFPASQARNQKKRKWKTLNGRTGLKSMAGIITSPAKHSARALKSPS